MEPGAQDPRREREREAHHSALLHAAHVLVEDLEERAGAVGHVEQLPFERAPRVAGHPDLAAARGVEAPVDPAERGIVVRRHGRLVRRVPVAVEAVFLHPVEAAGGAPVAVVVARRELALRAEPGPRARADAGRDDLELLSVLRDLEHAAVVAGDRAAREVRAQRALHVIEVPLRVGVEVHRELVVVPPLRAVVVEVLVEVRLAVAVEVAEDRHLVARDHVDQAVHDLEPARLEKSRGVPLPGELPDPVVDPRDDPDVAAPGAERRAAVREEVEAGEPEPRFPRVLVGRGERVDLVRAALVAADAFRDDRLGEARGAALREGRGVLDRVGLDHRHDRLPIGAVDDLEEDLLVVGGDLEVDARLLVDFPFGLVGHADAADGEVAQLDPAGEAARLALLGGLAEEHRHAVRGGAEAEGPGERALLVSREVEHLALSRRVGEDDPVARDVEAAVLREVGGERAVGLGPRVAEVLALHEARHVAGGHAERALDDRPGLRVGRARPLVGRAEELQPPSVPRGGPAEKVGVEADGAGPEPDGDPLGGDGALRPGQGDGGREEGAVVHLVPLLLGGGGGRGLQERGEQERDHFAPMTSELRTEGHQ